MIKIPDKEILWVQFLKAGVVTHVITSDLHREMYYLYKVDSKGNLKKTKWQSEEPTPLHDRVRKEIEKD